MLTSWLKCERCELSKKRKGEVRLSSNDNGKIMLILSESFDSNDRRHNFLQKVMESASESKLDSFDLAIVETVGCETGRSTTDMNIPFKDEVELTVQQIGACKERVNYLIDKVDPHIIIASGSPAARSLGITAGLTKMFNTKEVREVEIPGHLIKVPRMVAVVPTFNWLANNFSRDPEGPTALTVQLFRKCIDYSKLIDQVIGDKNV